MLTAESFPTRRANAPDRRRNRRTQQASARRNQEVHPPNESVWRGRCRCARLGPQNLCAHDRPFGAQMLVSLLEDNLKKAPDRKGEVNFWLDFEFAGLDHQSQIANSK